MYNDLEQMIIKSYKNTMKTGLLDNMAIIRERTDVAEILREIDNEATGLEETGNILPESMPHQLLKKDNAIILLLKRIDAKLYKNIIYRNTIRRAVKKIYFFVCKPDAIHVKVLLNSDDEVFLNHCYQIILKRNADSEGMEHWMFRLSTLNITQLEVAYLFLETEEGKRNAVLLKGMRIRYKLIKIMRKICKIPVIGRGINWFWKLFQVNKSIWKLQVNILNKHFFIQNHEKDIARLQQEINRITEDIINLKNVITSREDNIVHLQQEISGITEDITDLKNEIIGRENNVDFFEERISTVEERISTIEQNLRNNNILLEKHDLLSDDFNSEIENLKKEIEFLTRNVIKNTKKSNDTLQKIPTDTLSNINRKDNNAESSYVDIDYFDFENTFRGNRQHIKKCQEIYISYFKDKENVLDLGCGRGEFLELMKENGIPAIGVDFYEEFVELCRMRGLNAIHGDAIDYLKKCGNDLGGIFAGQLIEHLDIKQVIDLCNTAYDKLEQGGYLIMETPNPTALCIFAESFYMDPSHEKPVHPRTLQYIAQKAGFKETEILYTSGSRFPVTIPELNSELLENGKEFNASMKAVNNMLFGSQDYALIARK